jgi:hypothetical protein
VFWAARTPGRGGEGRGGRARGREREREMEAPYLRPALWKASWLEPRCRTRSPTRPRHSGGRASSVAPHPVSSSTPPTPAASRSWLSNAPPALAPAPAPRPTSAASAAASSSSRVRRYLPARVRWGWSSSGRWWWRHMRVAGWALGSEEGCGRGGGVTVMHGWLLLLLRA